MNIKYEFYLISIWTKIFKYEFIFLNVNFLIFLKVNFLFELIFLNVNISKKKYEFYSNSNYFLIFFSTKYLVEH